MKQKSFLLSLLTVLLHLTAWATSFTVDGIRYNTTSAWEVEVLAPSGGDRYQGAVNIPASVTYEGTTYRVTGIGDFAFQGAEVQTLSLPAGTIRTIGTYAFNDIKGITSLTIPASVTEIGANAFLCCTEMEHLFFCSPTPPTVASTTFASMKKASCKIHVPTGSLIDYMAIPEFSAFSNVDEWGAPEIYGIKVAGCLVTKENCANIFGDGSASYNESTSTLTITKDITTTLSLQPVVYNETKEGLIIVFVDCSLYAADAFTLNLQKETTLTGTATIEGGSVNPIYCWAPLTIMDATLNYSGPSGILGSIYEDLLIKNSNVTGTAVGVSPVTGFHDVILTDSYYQSPTGAHYDGTYLLDGNDSPVSAMIIKAGTPASYQLWVAGTQVTDQNCADILGGGEASYDPTANTLVLNKNITAIGTGVYGIDCKIPKLTIRVDADIVVSSAETDAIRVVEKTVIEGDHKLTLMAAIGCAIRERQNPLTIRNTEVIMDGCKMGINGASGTLYLENAALSGTTLSGKAAIQGFTKITTVDCYFEQPVGGKYREKQLVDLDGNPAATVVLVKGPKKAYPRLSFAREDYTTAVGKSFEAPELNNSLKADVTYASSNTDVAEVNATTGEVTIKAKGVTTITASCPTDDNLYADKASYFLTVLNSAAMLYDVNGDGVVSITDAVAVVNAILNGVSAAPEATPAPEAAPVEPEAVTSPE